MASSGNLKLPLTWWATSAGAGLLWPVAMVVVSLKDPPFSSVVLIYSLVSVVFMAVQLYCIRWGLRKRNGMDSSKLLADRKKVGILSAWWVCGIVGGFIVPSVNLIVQVVDPPPGIYWLVTNSTALTAVVLVTITFIWRRRI